MTYAVQAAGEAATHTGITKDGPRARISSR
jgi:hypothetical protein